MIGKETEVYEEIDAMTITARGFDIYPIIRASATFSKVLMARVGDKSHVIRNTYALSCNPHYKLQPQIREDAVQGMISATR